MSSKKIVFLLAIVFALWALAARFFPHAANMTPIGALALFAGVYLPRRWGWVVPLGVLLVSDAWLGGYELPVMLSVYGSFAAIALVGSLLRQKSFFTRSIIGPFASATLFFVVTNFAVWAATPWYAKNLAGLMTSYTLALPFWRNMLLGDIFYSTIFFGIATIIVRVWGTRFLNQELGIRNYGLSKTF
ncbi:MAG: hypothetical protein Q7S16_04615 [bacterium]|nr:hypothetical protein [bacterium]